MAVRKFKPVTPGTRHKIIGTFDEITTNVPEKSLVSVKKSSGGRNNTGKMFATSAAVTNVCIVMWTSSV